MSVMPLLIVLSLGWTYREYLPYILMGLFVVLGLVLLTRMVRFTPFRLHSSLNLALARDSHTPTVSIGTWSTSLISPYLRFSKYTNCITSRYFGSSWLRQARTCFFKISESTTSAIRWSYCLSGSSLTSSSPMNLVCLTAYRFVVCNPVYPWRELVLRVKAMQILIGFNKCVLNNVGRQVAVVCQVGDIPGKLAFVSWYDFSVSFDIALDNYGY